MNAIQMIPSTTLNLLPLRSASELHHPSREADAYLLEPNSADEYILGYAVSPRAIEDVQRLRYEVFNLEMGTGFAESAATGMDRDEFDSQMTHLVLIHRESARIVGTYRLQTIPHALANHGIYSAHYFDLAPLSEYFPSTVELGRLCIHPDHRTLANLHALWRGVGHFMDIFQMRWLLGCCSVVSSDPLDGWRVKRTLEAKKQIHEGPLARAAAGHECGDATAAGDAPGPKLPRLFDAYRRLGAKVVSDPSFDPDFGTVDFLIVLDAMESGFRNRPRAEAA